MPVAADPAAKFQTYAHPERVVSTEWLAEHLEDPNVVVVESDEDVLLYHTGHIPGAIKIDWVADLNDPLVRDYLDEEHFAALMSKQGISPETTVVFYGDNFNWWAAYALWVFELFGHADTRLLDGGRAKWVEEGRPLSTDEPSRTETSYPVPKRNDRRIRAFLADVLPHSKEGKPLIDVRSPEEFRGERLHMPDYPNEGALRGGHVPGARNVPWKKAANDDATFKAFSDLQQLYIDEVGLDRHDDVIAYCRIGERSAHTWFVLTQLLGFDTVRNYDGSWTEYGNAVRVPIERP
ncbi:MAG TPA: sulfurtransferase [Acidimicrobiia bacterium]|nr:sulfurtransferase [Acidimicrobiia bacterium]